MSAPETLCTGCGATVTMQGGRLRDSEANARRPNGYPWHTIAVSLPPVAIAPEPQHTPGPLTIAQYSTGMHINAANGQTICFFTVDRHDEGELADAIRAMAKLFAAAPDMLAALKEVVRVVGGTLQGYGVLEDPMKAAQAAISKAEDFMEEARRTR